MIKTFRTTTLCFFLEGEGSTRRVLLGRKKRGSGAGKFNGFGGKQEDADNGSIEATAIRECEEETGLTPLRLHKHGVIRFDFQCAVDANGLTVSKDFSNICHIFSCDQWTGSVIETEEMAPEWFSVSELPYAQMWPDDEIWLPKLLRGESVNYHYQFTEDGKLMNPEAVNHAPASPGAAALLIPTAAVGC